MDKITRSKTQEAQRVAVQVAENTAQVAREVASQASATAASVAKIAEETSKSILIFGNDLKYIQNDISEIKTKLDQKYVTKEEFDPVKKIVYGLVSLILIAVVGALIALVVVHK